VTLDINMNKIFFQNRHITILILRREVGDDMYCELSTPRYDAIKHHRWHAVRAKDKKSFYVMTNIRKPNGKYTCLLIHQIIHGKGADHVDRDGLNNQDHNLRSATSSQQTANRGMVKNNKSGHRGVWWNKANKKWMAGVRVNRKMNHVGYFINLEDAVVAVTAARKKAFGEFV
jgi:hypothetical protein